MAAYHSIARHDRTVGASVTAMEAARITHALRDLAHYHSVSEGIRALLMQDVQRIERDHATATALKCHGGNR